MKKFLMVLALSAAVGAANASVVEIENASKYKLEGGIRTVGAGICGERWIDVTVAPNATKTVDIDNCCVLSINFGAKKNADDAWGRANYEYNGKWGTDAQTEKKSLGIAKIRICGAKEKFKVSVYEKYKTIEIKNVTGK